METIVIVPQINDTQSVESIVLVPGQLIVGGKIRSSDGKLYRVEVDITAEWAAAQQANKDIIKAFIKKLGALLLDKFNESIGVDVTDQDVVGDVWD